MSYNFKKGDLVRKINGTKEIVVANDYSNLKHYDWIYGKYLDSGRGIQDQVCNFVLIENGEKLMKSETLYSFTKTDGTTGYGVHIGTNSQSKFLIEEKTTGEIHLLNESDLEEVVPYTIRVRIGSSDSHYVVESGSVELGDILITEDARIGVVKELDTKNKNAYARFKGRKVLTMNL